MTTYTLDQLDGFPWIVSTDTLRNEDLLVRYWQAAEQVLAIKGDQFVAPLFETLERLAGEDSQECNWDEEQAAQCVDDLAEILQEYAPTGFYFGASVGDGACFGFWLSEEWAETLENCGVAADSDSAALFLLIAELTDLGYDPENLADCYLGEAEGYDDKEAGANAAQLIGSEIVEQVKGSVQSGWPFSHIDWTAAWWDLQVSDNYSVVQWSRARWLVLAPC